LTALGISDLKKKQEEKKKKMTNFAVLHPFFCEDVNLAVLAIYLISNISLTHSKTY